MRRFLIVILTCSICWSCEDQLGTGNDDIPQEYINSSLQIFPGTILEVADKTVDGLGVWKILVENKEGAQIAFFWQKNYYILYQVVGTKGPYNYMLDLPLDVILFSTAKFLAFGSNSTEVLESWKLFRDKSSNNELVYQFKLKNNVEPISLKAASGDLL